MDFAEAQAFHAQQVVIDLHADTPKLMHWFSHDLMQEHERPFPDALSLFGHVDIPRMRRGGLSAQIFGMWTVPYPQKGCARAIHAQLDALDRATTTNPNDCRWTATGSDVTDAHNVGAISVMAGIEGAHALEGDLDNIAIFARRGVRYIGLVHFSANQLARPAMGRGADPSQGLTSLGRDAIREMNRVGMIVDLSHLNRPGFYEVLELTSAPVMVSHTGLAGVHDSWRNIDDDQIRAVADNGGCIGIIFARMHLGGKTLDTVCDHIIHLLNIGGDDVLALGSDFDGFVVPPKGLEDVAALPNLTCALAKRGVPPESLRKLLGENALRVLNHVPPQNL